MGNSGRGRNLCRITCRGNIAHTGAEPLQIFEVIIGRRECRGCKVRASQHRIIEESGIPQSARIAETRRLLRRRHISKAGTDGNADIEGVADKQTAEILLQDRGRGGEGLRRADVDDVSIDAAAEMMQKLMVKEESSKSPHDVECRSL